MAWKPLDDDSKRFISDEISRFLAVAAVKRHAPWAIHQMKQCLWFWTADGQDREGTAGRDKLKYSIEHLWHSELFCGLSREGCVQGLAPTVRIPRKKLRHDHAVPRDVIVRRLLTEPKLDAQGIHALLNRVCFGVILTKPEDEALNAVFRRAMPPGWSIDDPQSDPFARYTDPKVDLFRRLHPPRRRLSAAGHLGQLPARDPHDQPATQPAAIAGGLPDFWDPAVTLEVIAALRAQHGLRNAEFKRLHHGVQPSLGNHIEYCRRGKRFTTKTNATVCQRLLECLAQLERGASWEEAIARALEKYPLPER